MTRAWRCPYCREPTTSMYQCSNEGCEKDLAGVSIDRIVNGSDA